MVFLCLDTSLTNAIQPENYYFILMECTPKSLSLSLFLYEILF